MNSEPTPEQEPFVNLLRAILIQAIRDIVMGVRASGRAQSEMTWRDVQDDARTAREWILSDARGHFAFVDICEVCGFDSRVIRRAVNESPRSLAHRLERALGGAALQRRERKALLAATHATRASMGGISRQAGAVFDFMRESGRDWSRQELRHAMGICNGSACSQVHELMRLNLLVSAGRRKCDITGRNVRVVRAG